MKLRTVGSIMAGALMLGATLAGAVASADVPDKSWFIDQATGQPNVVIVVGATANANDVVSASILAGQVGNMATVQKEKYTTKTASATFDKVYPYNYGAPIDTEPEAGVVDLPRPAVWYTDYSLYGYQLWDTRDDSKLGTPGEASPLNAKGEVMYSTNVQLVLPSEVKDPNFQKTVARELNSLWFSKSPAEWDSKNRIYKVTAQSGAGSMVYQLVNTKVNGTPTEGIERMTLPALAGGSYDDGDSSFDFDYAFFTTKAWVDIGNTPAVYNDEDTCDYVFGGTGTGMEAHEEIQVITTDVKSDDKFDGIIDFVGDKGHASGIVYRATEIRYPLLENGQNICGVSKCDGMADFETAVKGYTNEIKFLGKTYYPLMAGATYWDDPEEQYLGAYFVSGKPHAQKETIMKAGETYNYFGWTIDLNDVNIYENKAYITVNGPELTAPFSFIMVMDSQGACTACCPTCAVYGGGGAFTSNPTQRNEYDPYLVKKTISIEKSDYTYDLFKYTSFMLDGIKTFVGADGTYLAEFNLYALDNIEYLQDKGCCDPFVTTPNDYGLAITGGWRKVAYTINERDNEIILPGEDDSPYDYEVDEEFYGDDEGIGAWVSWEDANDSAINYEDDGDEYLLYDYILWEPAPSVNKVCSDANFDTLELQLCDTIKVPNCETSYTINGPENYFTIEIQDVDFGKKTDVPFAYYQANGYYNYLGYIYEKGYEFDSKGTDADGVKIKISQTVKAETITYTEAVTIDPLDLIKIDIEINTTTNTKNLILVGGPVANKIVAGLVNVGESTVNWSASPGEWEWLSDPYARGYDVLIVAGANREETKLASVELVGLM